MICYNVRNSRPGPDAIYLVAELQADVKPDPMPLDGAGIEGMRAEERLDAGSRLLVLADGGSEWILGEDREWYEQKKSEGGGCGGYDGTLDPKKVYKQTRPKDWLPMPDPEDNEAWLLWQIPVGASAAIGIRVACSVSSIGYDVTLYSSKDGELTPITGQAHINGGSVYKSGVISSDDFDEFGETVTTDGNKQILINVKAGQGTNILTCYLYSASGSPRYNTKKYYVVDIALRAPECTRLSLSGDDSNKLVIPSTRYFSMPGPNKIKNIHTSSSLSSPFSRNESLIAVLELDTSNVTDISGLFYGCRSLLAIPKLDTSNATLMDSTFKGCHLLKAIPDLDTSKATIMNNLFAECRSLETLPKLNTSNVTSMTAMLYDSGIRKVRVGDIDLSNAENISGIFNACKHLTSIDGIDTANATNCNMISSGLDYALNMTSIVGISIASASTDIRLNSQTGSRLKRLTFVPGPAPGVNVNIGYGSVEHDAMVELFDSLPTITAVKNLTITGNPGADGLTAGEIEIATAKNWTVVGATNIVK